MTELDQIVSRLRSKIRHLPEALFDLQAMEEHSSAPDRRMGEIIGLLEIINRRMQHMSDTQDTIAAEVATLKDNMTKLHAGVTDIQARLAAALAGDTSDPQVVSDLHGINNDLASVIAAMAPAAPPPPTA